MRNLSKDIFFEIHHNLPREGPGRNEYTKRAFMHLPRMNSPRILDIGCGPGEEVIELAQLSQGEILAIDIHQPYLDILNQKITDEHLNDRVSTMNCSMLDMKFPDEHFDLIWSEGSIFIIGFERGLTEWKRYIKPGGYLVVHEMAWLQSNPPKEIRDFLEKIYPGITTIPDNLEIATQCNFSILGHFSLPDDAWWEFYYKPLENRIQDLRIKYANDPDALTQLDNEQEEIDLYRKYSNWYGSAFFILKKN